MSRSINIHAMGVPLGDQIREVKRELGMRRAVYSKRVDAGAMSREQSSKQITTMEAVLYTLEKLEQKEAQQDLPMHNPPR